MQALPSESEEGFARIVALHECVQPAEHSLEADVCTIGRWPGCQIVVRQLIVSRLHARIERNGPHYLLADAGSANGTFVNGRRISEPHLLKDDDLVGLGGPTPILQFVDLDPTAVVYLHPQRRLSYDEQAMLFYLGTHPLDLTPAQFRLLLLLYKHAGNVCTRESCAQAIWGRDYDPGLDAAALDEAVSKLRGRLRQVDARADSIKTRRGIGYELDLYE